MRSQFDSFVMKNLKKYTIPFVGLKQGNHLFEYEIDNKFFESFGFDEFHNSKFHVSVDFLKKSTLMELSFYVKGLANVDCDVSAETYDQEISGNFSLVVKFGPEFNDDNEEILIIPHEEYEINISQYIYELIALSIPTKKVHPKVLDGTMKSEALRKLEELEIHESSIEEETIDPRWYKLKDLITDKKT